ncbi:MAG: CRTAC1 family protein [Thermoanaerobaculia bacterium]|nr:CRTAC1 family protein [Thermoanaerobaculia bacterium]
MLKTPTTVMVLAGLLWSCGLGELEPGHRSEGPHFVDLEPAPDFVHDHGGSGRFLFPEVMGGGGALFDYDGDGDLDLYAVQGAALPGTEPKSPPLSDRLYQNQLRESGLLSFHDVTEDVLLQAGGYGMGAAVGDVDNDGRVDLFVTQWGANQLWRNLPDGTFEERANAAGIDDESWSVSASFLDFDGDGWLDLYVANYVDYEVDRAVKCFRPLGAPDYCSPLVYRPAADSLYRNRGDGTFEDVSLAAGILRRPRNGLGVVAFDANSDGLMDLFVANDMTPNHLWINQGDGTFVDRGLSSGLAANAVGKAEASMGVVVGDIDEDGDEDLIVSHLRGESNTLYLQEENGLFVDATRRFGLEAPSRPTTGFGLAFVDLWSDGWLDLAVSNGSVTAVEALAREGDPYPLHEPDQLFLNGEGMGFAELASAGGGHFQRSEVGRGLASGDLDEDGDVDLVLFNNLGPMRILLAAGAGGRWLGVEVRDDRYDRVATGAMVRLQLDDGRLLIRRIGRDGSYAVANDPRRIFGLGQAGPVRLEATWPDGWRVVLESPETERYHLLARPSDDSKGAT